MTPQDGESFRAFLLARVERARMQWNAVKQSQALNIERSYEAPEPDGTLLRRQARGGAEMLVYMEALRDLTILSCAKEWRPELLAEWQQTQRPERKPFDSAGALGARKRA